MSFSDQFKQYNIENYGYIRLPKIDISKEQKELVGLKESATNFEFLLQLAREGFKKKQNKIHKDRWKEYGTRVKYEIDLLEELGFIDYILLVWLVCNKADQLGVWRDFGRGSLSGSLVLWLIGVSGVDPIDKHLFFERFVSKTRAGKKIIDGNLYLKGDRLADADLNLGSGRTEIVKWLNEIYPNRVSKIINFSTLTTKILLKDVSKIYKEYSEDEAKAVSDLISSKFGVVQEIETAYKENEKFKQWADENKDIINIAKKLSGLFRQTSVHASGYLVSFFELTDIVPLELSKEGDLVSGYDMRQVSDFATKLDLLGLTTNGIIKDILDNITEKVEDIELDNNPIIYDQYQNNNLLPYGLYQISAHCAYGVLNKVKPKNIGELSDVNALARPGSLAYVDGYVKGNTQCLHPLFEPVLKETRNNCLYQESLMQLAVVIGFTLDDAETIRKIVGKKLVDKVKEWKDKVYKKVEEKGFKVEVADAYWKLLNDSASYSFNKCTHPLELVKTKNGIRHLMEINIGDEVLAYNTYSGKDHYVKVKDVIWGKAELKRWRFAENKSIICSENHKFLTLEAGMIKVIDIYKNNYTIIGWNNFNYKITDCDDFGYADSIDLEVDNKDHNFYCNNLVTSNSHSVATAYLSALTTYLKYKHPLQFYTSCLKGTRELADPIGEIHEIVKELPYFGIKLLPPDIIKSDLDFKIEDGNIRFGLSHIKGISDATIDKLLNFRRESTTTKFQLFEVAQQTSIPINVLAGLIYCGCLDGKGQNRARLVLEAQTYNILTDKEKILVHKLSADYNEDLLTIIKELTVRNNEKGKPYIKESRFATIKKKYDPYKQIYLQNSRNEELCSYIMERIFLGFSYTSSLQKIYESKYKGLKSIKDCNSEPKDVYCKFGGFITEIKKGKTKAKSTPYIKVQLSDETGGCQIMMFGEDKIKNIENFHGKELEEDQIIVVEGKSVGENTYFVDCVFIQDVPIKLKRSDLSKDIKI